MREQYWTASISSSNCQPALPKFHGESKAPQNNLATFLGIKLLQPRMPVQKSQEFVGRRCSAQSPGEHGSVGQVQRGKHQALLDACWNDWADRLIDCGNYCAQSYDDVTCTTFWPTSNSWDRLSHQVFGEIPIRTWSGRASLHNPMVHHLLFQAPWWWHGGRVLSILYPKTLGASPPNMSTAQRWLTWTHDFANSELPTIRNNTKYSWSIC